jgi:hypothetical protein
MSQGNTGTTTCESEAITVFHMSSTRIHRVLYVFFQRKDYTTVTSSAFESVHLVETVFFAPVIDGLIEFRAGHSQKDIIFSTIIIGGYIDNKASKTDFFGVRIQTFTKWTVLEYPQKVPLVQVVKASSKGIMVKVTLMATFELRYKKHFPGGFGGIIGSYCTFDYVDMIFKSTASGIHKR